MNDYRGDLPSASAIEQISLCPGSHESQKGQLRLDDDEAAKLGELIHDRVAAKFEGCDVGFDDLPSTASRCYEMATGEFYSFFGLNHDATDGMGFIKIVERRLQVIGRGGDIIATGRPDVVWIHNGRALVLDFKTGWVGAMEAPSNLQLRCLALAVASWWDVQVIRVGIISPNTEEPMTTAEYTMDDLTDSIFERHDILDRMKTGVRIPGAKQCRWCRAKHVCPEALGVVKQVADAIPQGTDPKATLVQHTPEAMATLLDQVNVAKWVCASVIEFGKLMIGGGATIPGYYLKPGKKRKVIESPLDAFRKLNTCDVCQGRRDVAGYCAACNDTGAINRMTEEEFLTCVKVSVPQLTKVYGKRHSLPQRMAKVDVALKLGDALQTKQDEPSLTSSPTAATGSTPTSTSNISNGSDEEDS
jgi:hypothetical protein